MTVRIAAAGLVLMLAACGGSGGNDQTVASPSADVGSAAGDKQPRAAFESPKDGAKVSSPVRLKMTALKIDIEESGVVREGAGHFHVMIDAKCVPNGKVIPEDAKHVHYGDASQKAKLKLDPGKHKLCLQLGDGAHKALGKTHTVKVRVK